MPTIRRSRFALPALCALLAGRSLSASASAPAPELPVLPLSFVPNVGQLDSEVRYFARAPSAQVFVTGDAVVLRGAPTGCGPGDVVKLSIVGADPKARLEPLGDLPGTASFFLGSDPSRWRPDVPTHSGVAWRGVLPGVDLVLMGPAGRLERELHFAAGVDPASVRLRHDGADSMRVRSDGALVMETASGELVDSPPVAWQQEGESRIPVDVAYALDGTDVGFTVGQHRGDLPLVIDPVLDFSSYLGGSGEDEIRAGIFEFGVLNVYGRTRSTDFPVVDAAQPNGAGGWDAFYTRISLTGRTLLSSTYIGGSGDDVAVGGRSDTVMGNTTSVDFPVFRAFSSTLSGQSDMFYWSRDASTYVGGSGEDEANSGFNPIVGRTTSPDLPITVNPVSALSPSFVTLRGPSDGFVMIVSRSLTGVWSLTGTYLGGTGEDSAYGIGGGGPGFDSIVIGSTRSTDFPTSRGAYQRDLRGGSDGFACRVTGPDAFRVAESTLLGGSGDDELHSASYETGSATVALAGWTTSTDLPVLQAVQAAHGGGRDGFVAVMRSPLNALDSMSYWGGAADDEIAAMEVDSSRRLTLAGTTSSPGLSAPGAPQRTPGGGEDAFVSQIVPFSVPPSVAWSTYLGGTGDERLFGMTSMDPGCHLVVGSTSSADFPSKRAVQPASAGSTDGFIARFCPEDELGRRDPAFTLIDIQAQLDRIETTLREPIDFGPLFARLDALEAGLGRRFDDLTSRLDALAARIDAEWEAELRRDVETALYEKECVPWLWLPDAFHGILEKAQRHVASRADDAEASRDTLAQVELARRRLDEAQALYAEGQYEKACQRVSDALRFLTNP